MIAHRAYPLDPEQTKIVSAHGKIMILNCSYFMYRVGIEAYKNGRLMQDAFPTLTDDEREFLISGMLPEEFEEMCAELEAHENLLYSMADECEEDN